MLGDLKFPMVLLVLIASGCDLEKPTEQQIQDKSRKTAIEEAEIHKKVIDSFLADARKIPASEACKNKTAYEDLIYSEDHLNTSYYRDLAAQKIEFYTAPCHEEQNPNYIGKWSSGYFVDDFGDTSDKSYLMMNGTGNFSNSATQNSGLRSMIFLNYGNSKSFFVRLYKYNGTVPLKNPGYDDDYNCRVKAGKDTEEAHVVKAFLGADSLSFGKAELLGAFIEKELLVKFYCYSVRTSSSTYRFSFDFKYFNKAKKLLSEK